VGGEGAVESAKALVSALRLSFQRDSSPIESLFKLATAFTHPRRIELYRALKGGDRSSRRLKAATRMSFRALRRHLEKLQARGFVAEAPGGYTVVDPADNFGRELARLAGE
jgi:predicted transcriptional regulator